MAGQIKLRYLPLGSEFTLGGQRLRLLYRNECRACVVPVQKRVVRIPRMSDDGSIAESEFWASSSSWNVSPDTMVSL